MEKLRKDHLKALSALRDLLDTAENKPSASVQVSFHPVGWPLGVTLGPWGDTLVSPIQVSLQ